MSTAKTTPATSSSLQTMPVIICLEGDTVAESLASGCQHYARLKFSELAHREADTIVIVSSERLLARFQPQLRGRHIRIIALSDSRYHDPRLDGAVYGYLPTNTSATLLERWIDTALDHMNVATKRRETKEQLTGANREITELNEIGAALSAEHDWEKLLEMILTKSRNITKSDAGSLYLVDEVRVDGEALPPAPEEMKEYGGAKLVVGRKEKTRKVLRFELAQNDTLGGVKFRKAVMEISDKSIAGYVVQTGEIVNLEDVYHLPEQVPYSFNRKFDENSGYRTKSIITVPMRNPNTGEIVGAVQLINAKRNEDARLNSLPAVMAEVVPYTLRQQEIVASLASQAAVALDNSRLYEKQQELFEGFVKASVKAIESRDPTTSGHSERVAIGTVALAELVDRAGDGPYRDVRFTRDQMKEIRYASLLHDFGKVGVREDVLVKAKKLKPADFKLLQQRFRDSIKRSLQVQSLQSQLKYAEEKGIGEYQSKKAEFEKVLAEHLNKVDGYFATVLRSNELTVLAEGSFEKLQEIAAQHFSDFEGTDQLLLTSDEVRLLSIRKGSLDDEERRQIEDHVRHTFEFLSKIPWTPEIRNVPEIARGHHEKLTGKGYPYKLAAPEIPLQTRMMTISDIFDALVAADRPYKSAVAHEKALQILDMEVKDGNVDENLFRLFVEAKVFMSWKTQR